MQSQGKGTTILVLGILSIVCCQFLGPVAWFMGNNAMSETVDPNEQNLVNIGRILGMIGTALLVLGIIVYGGIIALAVIGGAAGSATVPPVTVPATP